MALESKSILLTIGEADLRAIIHEEMHDLFGEILKEVDRKRAFDHLPENLTKKQTAQFLQVSIGSVENYYRQGRLKGVKLGRNIRFPKEDVIRIILEGGLKYKR